jgi:hypothetical protein
MRWIPDKGWIYAYATDANLGDHAALSVPFFRRKSRWRALLLLPFVPLESLYLLMLWMMPGRRRQYAFLNTLAIQWLDATDGAQTIVLGSIVELRVALRKKSLWIPVGPLYVLLAWSSWQSSGHLSWPVRRLLVLYRAVIVGRLRPDAWLVVHSDALPLARALASVVKSGGGAICCVQHGIFDPNYFIPQIDGSQSDLNVVRSALDAEIIRRASQTTRILTEPALFHPAATVSASDRPKVLLVGEAWHLCDSSFDKLYRSRLRAIEGALRDLGISVSFRAHPSERYRAWTYGFRRTNAGPKASALQEFNIYVGFASTMLNEAASAGHLAIQLTFDDRPASPMEREPGQLVVQAASTEAVVSAICGWRPSRGTANATHQASRRDAVSRVLDEMASFRTSAAMGSR